MSVSTTIYLNLSIALSNVNQCDYGSNEANKKFRFNGHDVTVLAY